MEHATLPPLPEKTWSFYLSWCVIIFITLGIFLMTVLSPLFDEPESVANQSQMMQINMAGKMLVGQGELLPNQPASANQQLDDLNTGSLEQRYGVVFLQNEVIDLDEAEQTLSEIDELVEKQNYQPTENQTRLRKIVGDLLDQYKRENWDSNRIAEEDRDFLVSQLGWVGRLGMTPAESPNVATRQEVIGDATNTMVVMISMCFVGFVGIFLGLAGIVMFIVLVARGKLRSHFELQVNRMHLYLETFAIWMAVFVAAQFMVALIGASFEIQNPLVGTGITLFVFFGSLGVLIWPVLRGLTFAQVREDIGWTLGNPFKEIGAGIVSYCSMIPALGIAFVVVSILMAFTTQTDPDSLAPTGGAIHPIQDQIATGDIWIWVGVFLTACIAAPIVEETMFRGVFYRYLRDASSRRAVWASVLIASLVNGLIFASIHPQGIVGLPLLTTLAVGMSLARQWRGSLIASMTMHAMNNGLVTCLMFSIF